MRPASESGRSAALAMISYATRRDVSPLLRIALRGEEVPGLV